MKSANVLIRALAVSALVFASTASHASLIAYFTQASFLGAVSAPVTDTFNDLSLAPLGSPLARTAGVYGYTASAANDFFPAGSIADVWLSTDDATDSITFNAFSPGVVAIGGFFFGSDIGGAFLSGQSIILAATDGDGTLTQTISAATTASFLGFVSTGLLSSLTVTPVQPTPPNFAWPTVNDLTLAASRATNVPEPASLALLGLGLAGLGFSRRRKS